jgi:hypothetical protein
LAQPLATVREVGPHRGNRHAQYAGCLLVGEFAHFDQKQHRLFPLRKLPERAQEIAMFGRRISAAVGARPVKPNRAVAPAPPLPVALVSQEAMVEDREKPAAQVYIAPAPVPASENTFETFLHEIVGALAVALEQCASETAQAGYVSFEQSRLPRCSIF